ncbi:hypothetical protein [Rhodococcus sp. NPDC049939]|uniref:DUF7373 family lipoprotein n=1 Tax=Rhodococcus sp. NPDC049939 TaxID=3155511 RepID=UPI0033CF003D
MKKLHRPIYAATAIAMAMTLAGCGSAEGSSDPTGGSGMDAPQLDPGAFPTTAQPESGPVADETEGRKVEGIRMAQYVSLPAEIDASLVEQNFVTALDGTDTSLTEAMYISDDGARAVAEKGLVAGYTTSGNVTTMIPDPDGGPEIVNPDMRTVSHGVFRFTDAAAATAGAQAMHAAMLEPYEPVGPGEIGQISVMPNSLVVHRSEEEFGVLKDTLQAITVHGNYVISTQADAPAEHAEWNAKAVANALAVQEPLIDQFEPTPLDKIDELPADPTGLLRYTIPEPEDTKYPQPDVMVLGARGYEHESAGSTNNIEELAEANFVAAALDRTTVMRTASNDDAKTLAALTLDEYKTDGYTVTDSPAGLPEVPCYLSEEVSGDYIECVLTRGPFVAIASSQNDATEAHQLAAAQYMILGDAR